MAEYLEPFRRNPALGWPWAAHPGTVIARLTLVPAPPEHQPILPRTGTDQEIPDHTSGNQPCPTIVAIPSKIKSLGNTVIIRLRQGRRAGAARLCVLFPGPRRLEPRKRFSRSQPTDVFQGRHSVVPGWLPGPGKDWQPK
jgi:hypothetical protein